jgi:hypothetical protein
MKKMKDEGRKIIKEEVGGGGGEQKKKIYQLVSYRQINFEGPILI